MTNSTKSLSRGNLVFFAALFYTLVITYLFFGPPPESGTLPFNFPYFDKLVHFIIHFIFVNVWLYFFFFRKAIGISTKKIVFVCGFCILYGIIVEVLQPQISEMRKADVFDFFANLAGTLTGLLAFKKTKGYFQNL